MRTEGKHLLLDVWCKGSIPNDLQDTIQKAMRQGNLTVVDHIVHHFTPYGTTEVWILAESHVALHTYPEHHYFSIEVYVCGSSAVPDAFVHYIIQAVDPLMYALTAVKRGYRNVVCKGVQEGGGR